MAEPYSQDLRERVVGAVDEGETREEAAERFGVSVRFVYDMLRLRRETGSLAPRPHAGGAASAVDDAARDKIGGLVKATPDGKNAKVTPFVTGFLDKAKNDFWGRPTDVMLMPDGSVLVSDEQMGAIYRVSYKK